MHCASLTQLQARKVINQAICTHDSILLAHCFSNRSA
jgi:hypothetical protein